MVGTRPAAMVSRVAVGLVAVLADGGSRLAELFDTSRAATHNLTSTARRQRNKSSPNAITPESSSVAVVLLCDVLLALVQSRHRQKDQLAADSTGRTYSEVLFTSQITRAG